MDDPDDDIIRRAAERRQAAAQHRDEIVAGTKAPWPPAGERTPQQQAEVEAYEVGVAWLKGKWGDEPKCPYCGNNEWSVGVPTHLTTRPRTMPTTFGSLPAVFPVMCTNCGQTVFVSAILAGSCHHRASSREHDREQAGRICPGRIASPTDSSRRRSICTSATRGATRLGQRGGTRHALPD